MRIKHQKGTELGKKKKKGGGSPSLLLIGVDIYLSDIVCFWKKNLKTKATADGEMTIRKSYPGKRFVIVCIVFVVVSNAYASTRVVERERERLNSLVNARARSSCPSKVLASDGAGV